MSNLKKKFGKRVKELRKSRGLTQEKIAELINIEPPNISKMESGTHFPLPENIEKLAKALDVEVKDLFDFEHFQTKNTLISQINDFFNKTDLKDIELMYKFSKNLQEYKK